MQNKRDFGLILNNLNKPTSKKQPIKTFVSNNNECSSDEEEITQTDYKSLINKSITKQQEYNTKKISEEISKNIQENPNLYDYDSHYENSYMKQHSSRSKNNSMSNFSNDSVDDTKPKYLNAILAASEKRKIEQSIIKEKVEKKRRERELGEYGDKQKFVTKSYEEALAVNKRREIELENKEKKNTVNSEYGMMGFYSNLLTKNTAMGARSKEDEEKELLKFYQNKKKEYEKVILKNVEEDEKKSLFRDGEKLEEDKTILRDMINMKENKDSIISENKNKNDTHEKGSSSDIVPTEKASIDEFKLRYLERKRHRDEKKESI